MSLDLLVKEVPGPSAPTRNRRIPGVKKTTTSPTATGETHNGAPHNETGLPRTCRECSCVAVRSPAETADSTTNKENILMTATKAASVSRGTLVTAFVKAWLSEDQNAHLPGVLYQGEKVTVTEAIKLLSQDIIQEALYRVGYTTRWHWKLFGWAPNPILHGFRGPHDGPVPGGFHAGR